MAQAKRTPTTKPKKIGLYSREFRDLISSSTADNIILELFGNQPEAEEESAAASRDSSREHLPPVSESGKKDIAKCLSCGTVFRSRDDQVSHYQLDWHRYNLKRRLKGLSAVDQEQFEMISDDMSSISGSESDSSPSEDNTGIRGNESADVEDNDKNEEEEEEEVIEERPAQLNKSPYLQFGLRDRPGLVYSLFHSVMSHSHSDRTASGIYQSLAGFLKPQVWIILMRSGGHFAGAVYRGSELVAHKTFHRYTVRAKRGTAQSVRDGQQGGHQPKSAGASLRRYNESALAAEIQGVIGSWSSYVQEASCIFVRTPKYSKWVFIGEKGAFPKGDERLRPISFQTRRPTLAEVRATFDKLSSVSVRSALGEAGASQAAEGRGSKVEKKLFTSSEERNSELVETVSGCGFGSHGAKLVEKQEIREKSEELVIAGRCEDGSGEEPIKHEATGCTDDKETSKNRKKKKKKLSEKDRHVSKVVLPPFISDLLSLVADPSSSSLDRCQEILRGAGLLNDSIPAAGEPETQLQEESLKLLNTTWNGDTILHTAAMNGCMSLIPILMEHGADPTLRNAGGHTPYISSKNKSTRDAFRRFMASHPSKWDYSIAQIPSPLTEEMEQERSKKEAEKRREKRKKKAKEQQERQALVKKEEEEKRAQLGQQRVLGTLTQREKLAMAAERRMASQLPTSAAALSAGVCSGCGQSLLGVVPFERLDYKYCSMDCLKQHRTVLSQHKH